MNLKKLNIIIGREYLNKVRKKSFLLTTFGVPILIAAMYVVMILIMLKAKDEAKVVGVVDESGIVLPTLENNDVLEFRDVLEIPLDSLKNAMGNYGIDFVFTVSEIDPETKNVRAATYSEKPLGVETVDMLKSRVDKAVESYRIDSYGIDGLAQIMTDVRSNVSVKTYTISSSGEEKITESSVYMILSMLLSMGLYMFIAIFSGMVMTSVIEEKSSRVVEVLVSSVKATELLFGKIIGVALVALTQFLLWIVLSGVIIGGVGAVVGFDKIAGVASATEYHPDMSSMGVPEGATLDMGSMLGAPGDAATAPADTAASSDEPTGIQAVFSTLSELNIAEIIVVFLLFFVFGYLLYASLFAAIGSAVENEADTQQLQIPITIPLLIGFFIAFYAFRAPDSAVVFWGSMIPFTSPIVMLARVPFGVPLWELLLSLGLLVGTFIACAWLSAKIYKVGILMYGKKSSFKDLWKWLKMK
ncbi:MAG: ABC transporter permease [Bacteroidales bacterium]|nr:ABC transporter permease [Bacteroidales bacterium]